MEGSIVLAYLAMMAGSYLAGSVPMGVLVAKLSGGPDPRTIGSGRTGGTNALRALGRKWAAVVVTGDLLKGALPVLAARALTNGDTVAEVLCAGSAVAGAVWSVFVGFRSGRGVGAGVGSVLVIQPLALLVAAPVFAIVILVTRYVSLGSLIGSAAIFPGMLLVTVATGAHTPTAYLAWTAVGPVFIWLAHIDNIQRLLRGTERRFDLALLGGRRGRQEADGAAADEPAGGGNRTTRAG